MGVGVDQIITPARPLRGMHVAEIARSGFGVDLEHRARSRRRGEHRVEAIA